MSCFAVPCFAFLFKSALRWLPLLGLALGLLSLASPSLAVASFDLPSLVLHPLAVPSLALPSLALASLANTIGKNVQRHSGWGKGAEPPRRFVLAGMPL